MKTVEANNLDNQPSKVKVTAAKKEKKDKEPRKKRADQSQVEQPANIGQMKPEEFFRRFDERMDAMEDRIMDKIEEVEDQVDTLEERVDAHDEDLTNL